MKPTQSKPADSRKKEPPVGLACSKCGCQHLLVVYTRPREGCILRVRSCRHCGRRIVTRERQ
jgi:hypothetical protein